jgi:hypothetical protein
LWRVIRQQKAAMAWAEEEPTGEHRLKDASQPPATATPPQQLQQLAIEAWRLDPPTPIQRRRTASPYRRVGVDPAIARNSYRGTWTGLGEGTEQFVDV